MKYGGFVEIGKPQSVVAEYFANPEFLGEYQDGFEKKEVIEGEAGQEGTVSKLYYKYGERSMELTETVTSNNLPDSFEAFYHHEHMDNTMKCKFIAIDENTTRYEYEFEYTRIDWIRPRLMTILFPGIFKKQGRKWMLQFKDFVENHEVKTNEVDTIEIEKK